MRPFASVVFQQKLHPNAGPSRALGQCPNCSGIWDDNTDNDEDGVAIACGLEGEGRCECSDRQKHDQSTNGMLYVEETT